MSVAVGQMSVAAGQRFAAAAASDFTNARVWAVAEVGKMSASAAAAGQKVVVAPQMMKFLVAPLMMKFLPFATFKGISASLHFLEQSMVMLRA